jgi:hypothetical protein
MKTTLVNEWVPKPPSEADPIVAGQGGKHNPTTEEMIG